MSFKEAFAKTGIYPKTNPGEVWKASDSSISLLGRVARHWHEERYCVILSNKEICDDPDWPLVLIPPLSHQLFPKPKADLYVDVTDKNGLQVKSRIILSQIQPLQKISLQERMGEISITKWEQVLKQVFWHLKRQ